ncbi:MAG: glycoside hydrolase family 127 protein [Verrucomicrobiota bacterium]
MLHGLAPRAAAAGVPPVVPPKVVPFDLTEVRLLEGPFQHAMEMDQRYLLSLDTDRLLHNFRINAGLPSSAEPLGGWEKPDCELRGHFVGHYLSACALMYASTGDELLKKKGDAVVAGLAECQQKLGTGYLSAFPETYFDRVEAQKQVWAPYYTLHKLYAGLLDMAVYVQNRQTLEVCKRFADWVIARNAKLSDEQMQMMLGNEHGGMNEALANLYALTGQEKYLKIAQRFNHMAVLGPASRREDKLTGLHANTQIPKFIGTARQYELTGQDWLKTASQFFWETVVNERSYVIGGHSDGEAFTPKETLSQALGPNTTETCNTYNMLKLTQHLFEWEPNARYADYYERALYNHILASQNPADGMTCYYVPLRSGSRKQYSTPTGAFWCCTGTGIENHAKYGEDIYFHNAGKDLYLNLFIASELHWKEKGLKLRQETRFPEEGASKLLFSCGAPVELTLHLRHPHWAVAGFEVRVNGRKQWLVSQPGEYAILTRTWQTGDVVELSMPFSLRTESFRDNPRRFAVLNGPLVLSAEIDSTKPVPAVVGSPAQFVASLKPLADKSNTFVGADPAVRIAADPAPAKVTLEPFYQMQGDRHYVVYWDSLTDAEWQTRDAATQATVTVQADQPAHRVSPKLWGLFFEDINLSADGGIYPELVRNRSFEEGTGPEHWVLLNTGSAQSEIAVDTSHPLNPLNRRSLRVRLNGSASLRNDGYWGMNVVKGARYQLRLAARGGEGFQGPITVALQSRAGASLAAGEISGVTERWQSFAVELEASESDPEACFQLVASGRGILWLDMVSLLPEKTWKGHGLRSDLCEMMSGLKPGFLRFPGGCWVEGEDVAHMYHWKETIGDVAQRKPLQNIWGYQATHGVGYHEYLQLAEDLGAEPLFCLNVGMSHRENIPMDQMGQWVQDALDAIEYANGPTHSIWGAARAKNGHPAPFRLRYLEIGNENGGPAYQERYALFHDAIKARYPEMQLIANVPTHSRPADIVDEHYYNNPEFFIAQADRYDSYPRNGAKIFVGEYAVTMGAGQGNLRGAIGEAAFMTGLERNSDVVLMASYAPLFVNVHHRRWNPDLINFDSSRVYGLPSYYVQQLFGQNRGDVVLPIQVQSPFAEERPKNGAVGVGTWLTQAEFKDLRVTKNGQTLYAGDFSNGTQGWRLHGGDWKAENGVLRQTSTADNIRAVVGDKSWTDYAYSLKARKLSGAEGFLILFRVQDESAKSWWNLGGWGNQRHAVELGGVVGNEVPGEIETGRWYDIRIELKGDNIRCYLDDELIHDIHYPAVRSLHASATKVESSGDVILKVVNSKADWLSTDVDLKGVASLAGPIQMQILTSASATDENSLEEPTRVAPVSRTLEVAGPRFRHFFPGNSLTVMRIKPGR